MPTGLGRTVALALLASACGPPEAGNPPVASVKPAESNPASQAAPAPTRAGPVISQDGFGPLKVGMTVAEAAQALGAPLEPAYEGEEETCRHYGSAAAPKDVIFMFQDGRLTRVTAHLQSPAKTDKGLGLGAREADVRAAYGPALTIEPHHYVGEPAHYLTAWADGRTRGVRYETDAEGAVTEIHGGDESIRLVEGCA